VTLWIAVLTVGAGSYAIRLGSVVAAGRHELSRAWDAALGHARTAGLAALATSSLVQHERTAGTSSLAGSFLAVVVAAGLARRRAPSIAMVAGIAVYTIVSGALASAA
jgi:branched-subunit amino acid transport protein